MNRLMRRREVIWEHRMVGAALARRVATASGQINGPDGTVYAHATTTCVVFEPHRQGRSGGIGDGR